MTKNTKDNIFFCIVLFILALTVMSVSLYRSLWFDEALTLINFVNGKNIREIYNSYIIPNNQIIYTMILSVWTEVTAFMQPDFDFCSRLLSVIFSGISLIALYFGFKREFGGRPGIILISAGTVFSIPFILYGTAVRGYQLSFMLLIFLAWSVKNISRKVSWKNISAYALLSLLLVGTIPTNLLGIGMAVGIFMPELWGKWKRIAALAIIPFAMLGLFYFPIWSKFIKVCQLGEGLNDRTSAILVPYIAFLLNYSILIIVGTWGWILACKRRYIRYKNLFRAAAVMLWIIPCLVLKVAPFNRVFYPCFALLIIVSGFGIKHWIYLFYRKLAENRQKITAIISGALIIGNLFIMKNDFAAQKIQHFLNLTPMTDDFFKPYYFEERFFPPAVINKINKEYIDKVNMVFLTFEADSRALHFYATFSGSDNRKYLLDGPIFKVSELPPDTLIVLPVDGDMDKYKKRFNLYNRTTNKIFVEGWHEVWEVQ